MTRLRATLLAPALLAGLAGQWLGGCALDSDGEEQPEGQAPLTSQDGEPTPDAGPAPPDTDAHSSCDDGCTSTMTEFGLVCTTCPGDGDAPPECLVGECGVHDRCLECTDPKGHVATDCSIDYESLPTTGSGYGGGDTFDVIELSYGYPNGTSAVAHYPGTDSCVVDEEARCIDCTYADGSGSGVCLGDPDEPLPEVMAGRPSTLPPPGECVNQLGPDGAIVCSTCTRDDLSASKMCRLPRADFCDVSHSDNPIEKCMACWFEGVGVGEICDDAGT